MTGIGLINAVVEGESDRGMVSTLVACAGGAIGNVVVKKGKNNLDPFIPNYVRAAQHAAWAVFRDSDGVCPVERRHALLQKVESIPPGFLLRLPHSMSETWLLADTDGFAKYFSISRDKIPRDVESLPHGKATLLTLCAQSRSRDIRDEVVRANGKTGELYVMHLNEYASTAWDPSRAVDNSPSLRRSLVRLRTLAEWSATRDR